MQKEGAEHQNRSRERTVELVRKPLYEIEDVEQVIGQMIGVPYRKSVEVADGIQAIWAEAGHMLGSASIQLLVQEDSKRRSVIFSGDLGPKSLPMLRDFEPFQHADLVFLDSTYGNRNHRPFEETVDEFVHFVNNAVSGGGKVLVPTFAVGRAQLLIGLLG